jgi:hypothetical protein
VISSATQDISISTREVIARVLSCVNVMQKSNMQINDTSLMYLYEASLNFKIKEMTSPAVMFDIVSVAERQIESML